MNKFLKSYIALLLFVAVTIFTSQAQCPNTNTYSGIDMGTPPCGTFDYAPITAGEYILVNVISGAMYQFSTCGASFDTQITGYNDIGGSNLFFNDDNGPICSGNNASTMWTATFTGQLRILVNKFSCANDGTPVNIGVSMVNVISFSAPTSNGSTINRCLQSVDLTLAATPSGGVFSGTGVIGNQFSPSNAGIGLHEITYTSGFCTRSIFVNVVPEPTVSFMALSSSVCPGDSITIQAVLPSPSYSPYTYTWSTGDINVLSVEVPAGTYSLTIENAYGCSSTNSTTINAAPVPSPAILGDNAICDGETTTLTATGGNMTSTYLWSTGETTPTIDVSTTGNYTVEITNIQGCSAISAPFAVTVSPPVVTVNHPMQSFICPSGNPLTPTNSSDNYLWSPTGEISQSIIALSPQTYTVTITNNDGCTIAVEEFEIAGVGIPLIFHPAQILCYGDILTPTNTAANYYWIPNGEITQSVAVSTSGTYRVILRDINGCDVSSERFPVTVRPVINANIDVDFCTAIATVTLTGGSPEIIGDDYIVTNNGSGTFNGLPITHNGNFSIDDLTSGDWIDFTVEDSYGCSYHFEQAVVVDVTKPTVTCPAPQPPIPLTGCIGIMPDYTGLIVASDACNFTITQAGPIPGTTFPPGYASNVLFSIIDEMGNARVCSMPFSVALDTENPVAICQDINVNISILGTAEFTFTDLDGGSTDNCGINYVNLSNTIFNCSEIGDNTVTVTIYDNAGNSATCQSTVTVIDPYSSTISAGADTLNVCYLEPFTLSGSIGGSATGAYWTTNGGGMFDDPTLPNATYTPWISDGLDTLIFIYTTDNSPCNNFTSDTLILITTHTQVASAGGTNPTCFGNDGYISILLTTPFSTFNISYELNSIVTNTTLTTDASGTIYLTGLAAGTYTILSIEQNGCYADNLAIWNDIILTDPASLNLYVSNTNPSICNANDGSLVISGFAPNTTYNDLSYFDGTSTNTINSITSDGFGVVYIPNMGGGTYSNFNLDLGSCSTIFDNTPITIVNPILPVPFINYIPTPHCDNDIVTLTATPYGASTIQWYDISDLTTPIATGLTYSPTVSTGTNTYCITNSINGCESNTFCLDVDASAYPNPPLMVDTTLCEGTAIALPGISSSGGIVHFYDDASLTNFLGSSYLMLSSSLTGSHTFYATEEVSSCISAPVEFTVTFINCVIPCVTPVLITGPIECNSSTNTYTVYYAHFGSIVTASAGVINQGSFPYSVSNIPFGTDVIITASTGTGCDISQMIMALNSCPTNCVTPILSVGQGVCQGTGEYSIIFSETTGASMTANAGNIVGNSVVNIPIGTHLLLTATNGSCVTTTGVQSPNDCSDPCLIAPISLSNGICAIDGSYSINFSAAPGAIVTTNYGTISGNQIINIPSGVNIEIIVSLAGCDTFFVSRFTPPDCPNCTSPSLTMGPITCNATNSTYGISFFASAGSIITTNTGTIIGNTVIDIPFGNDLTIIATIGDCETEQTVIGLTTCPNNCVYPNLTTGQGVCQGTSGYSVAFSETTGATISVSAGTLVGNTITNIPVGTDVVVTATNGACEMSSVIVSPSQCFDPCTNPPNLSVGNISCDDVNNTYSVDYYSNTSMITVTAGTITPTSIVDIPFGVDLTITANNGTGCEESQTINGLNSCPSDCSYPNLIVGQAVCQGNNLYSVNFIETSGAIISTTIGTISNYNVINIPIGTAVTITATNGACKTVHTIQSPADCFDPCTNPAISLGGPICAIDGSATYSVNFVTSPNIGGGSVNAGTITPNAIIDIPSGIDLILNTTITGCNTVQTIVPAPTCPECTSPTLTTGPVICNPTNSTYSVSYNSDATSVTASSGTVTANNVIDIPFGVDITITASNGPGCVTTQTVTALTTCPTNCVFPTLVVGQGVCESNGTYSVAFSSDGAINSASVGTINGNIVTGIPIGTDITITSENGTCITSTTIISPSDCSDPCANAPISVAGAVCDPNGNATYSVSYSAQPGTIVTATSGTVTPNAIIDIPSGTDITITAVFTGCDTTTINIVAPTCPECTSPTLTTGPVICDATNSTYSVSYTSDATSVTASSGTVTANNVIDIPFGVDITITASNGPGCVTTQTVTALTTCPTNCVFPTLVVGQGVCESNGTYSVAFSSDGAINSASVGTINGNIVTGIPIGTDITITSENGTCITSTTIISPSDCSDPCANAPISVAGAVCNPNGNATYSVSYSAQPGTIVTATSGTITPNAIINIPSGTDITITAVFTGCNTTTIDIIAPTCPECTSPTLTTGPVICNPTNSTYSVSYNSDATSVTASSGTVTANNVIDIPFGVDITITASNGPGCVTTQTVTALTTCPTNCVFPTLVVGQGVCESNGTYSVAFSSDGAINSASVGTINGNIVSGIPVGTDITITSENGTCITSTTIISPSDCSDPCANAPISVAGAVCDPNGNATYSVSYSAQPGTIVTATSGTITPNAIINIPSGTDITITAVFTGCDTTTIDIIAPTCPECGLVNPPTVTGGGAYCIDDISKVILSATPTNVLWYSDNNLTNEIGSGSMLTPFNVLGSTTYYVISINGNCISEPTLVSVTLNSCNEFEIPTAFTPNSDGTNDYWEIPGLKDLYPDNVVRIYNRWGNLLFESNGYDIPWDGKFHGEDLPVASYYFIIELNDGVQEALTGTVTIVKKK